MRMQEAVAAKAVGDVQGAAKIVRKWRVIQCNTHAEKIVRAAVKKLGFETYLPMAITERPKTARRAAATLIRPFLPGYMFARFNTEADDWGELFTTHGVKGILRGGSAVLAVPDKVVDAIRQREEGELLKISDPTDQTRWKHGDRITVMRGRAEIEAVFDELLDKNRAVVFVSFLGRVTRQTITPLHIK